MTWLPWHGQKSGPQFCTTRCGYRLLGFVKEDKTSEVIEYHWSIIGRQSWRKDDVIRVPEREQLEIMIDGTCRLALRYQAAACRIQFSDG